MRLAKRRPTKADDLEAAVFIRGFFEESRSPDTFHRL
jgi:hypothetical protein